MKHFTTLAIGALLLVIWVSPPAFAQPPATAAKMVTWQPKEGMERDFEEGYKRHLGWHRRNSDPWVWHGWTLISGDRTGTFIDGSFFHAWSDFDTPLKPAEDSADNALNVEPYADVKNVTLLEAVPDLSNIGQEGLKSPLMIFLQLSVAPGGEERFHSALASAFQAKELSSWPRLVMRPITGGPDYLLLLPTARQSEMPSQQHRIALLLRQLNSGAGESALITGVRNELARYREDLSYARQ